MKEKMTPHIIAVVALVVFIGLGLACSSTPSSSSGGYSSSSGSSGGGGGSSGSEAVYWIVTVRGYDALGYSIIRIYNDIYTYSESQAKELGIMQFRIDEDSKYKERIEASARRK